MNLMVKYGILSDTHINESEDSIELNKLYEKIKQIFQDVDEIIHAGDVCTEFFLRKLEKIKPVKCVSGNTDEIRNLKRFITFNTSCYNIGVIHVPPEDLEAFIKEKNLHVLIHGHTHQPHIQGTVYNALILNPGSPTRPRALPQKIGYKEPLARKTVLTLDINEENNIITTFIITI